MMPRRLYLYLLGLLLSACGSSEQVKVPLPGEAFEKLSDYGLFTGELGHLEPAANVLPYELSTPLFSDYAEKARFVRVPEGSTIRFTDTGPFTFPRGTVVAKNFYYPGEGEERKIMETRILHLSEKGWESWPYIWNEAQTEAYLEIAGGYRKVAMQTPDGQSHELNYMVPNKNQCKNCHDWTGSMQPIGLQAKHLNKHYTYPEGSMNQLEKWASLGWFEEVPDVDLIAQLADWEAPLQAEPSPGILDLRARSYLDINCGHCHNPQGSAKNSGLNLLYEENNLTALGLNKPPIAAGRGSGGRRFGIVPGHPESSILLYRMESEDPGEMMPEMGRKLRHEEGIALIREWIAQMAPVVPDGS